MRKAIIVLSLFAIFLLVQSMIMASILLIQGVVIGDLWLSLVALLQFPATILFVGKYWKIAKKYIDKAEDA